MFRCHLALLVINSPETQHHHLASTTLVSLKQSQAVSSTAQISEVQYVRSHAVVIEPSTVVKGSEAIDSE